MSAAALQWVLRQRVGDASMRRVLTALADAADRTNTCELTQSRIAERSGLKERAVRSTLRLLEHLGLIERTSRGAHKTAGRQADLITIIIAQDIALTKEQIMAARNQLSAGLDAGNTHDITGSVPVAPASEINAGAYKARARAYSADASDINSPTGARGRVWFERKSEMWRARLHYEGLSLDLGRHECRELAEAECRSHIRDIEHAETHRSGTPREPKVDPSLKSLPGGAFIDFLDDEARDEGTGAKRPASGSRDQQSLVEGEAKPRDRPKADTSSTSEVGGYARAGAGGAA